MNSENLALFASVIVTFFVIIDPLACLPIFVGLTRKETKKRKIQLALQAVLVSFSVILTFALLVIKFLAILIFHFPLFKHQVVYYFY